MICTWCHFRTAVHEKNAHAHALCITVLQSSENKGARESGFPISMEPVNCSCAVQIVYKCTDHAPVFGCAPWLLERLEIFLVIPFPHMRSYLYEPWCSMMSGCVDSVISIAQTMPQTVSLCESTKTKCVGVGYLCTSTKVLKKYTTL